MSKKQLDNTNTSPKNFDYTALVGRLMTAGLSDDSHQTELIKPVYLPTKRKKMCNKKIKRLEICK